MTTGRANMDISLSDIANGDAQNLFDHALREVLKNINDVNTDFATKRKITLTFDISADEYRELLNVDIACRHTLASRKPSKARLALTMGSGGVPQAYEVIPKGQATDSVLIDGGGGGFNALTKQA